MLENLCTWTMLSVSSLNDREWISLTWNEILPRPADEGVPLALPNGQARISPLLGGLVVWWFGLIEVGL